VFMKLTKAQRCPLPGSYADCIILRKESVGPIGSLVLNYPSMSGHDRYNANKLDIKLPEDLRSALHQLVVIVYRTNRGL